MSQWVDLTADDEGFDEDNNQLLAHFGEPINDEINVNEDDLEVIIESAETQSSSYRGSEASPTSFSRNGPIIWPCQTLPTLPFNEVSLKPGDTVELKPDLEEHGDFLYIQHIIENVATGNITLRGLRLRRTKFMGGALDRKLNELCMVIQEDEDDDRDPFIQGAIEVSQRDVLRLRNLVFSEKDFPNDSYREFWTANLAEEQLGLVRDRGRLICRWVWFEKFENAAHRKKLKAKEGFLRRIRSTECVDRILPHSNRGKAHQPSVRSQPGAVRKVPYTYGTGCCGAGGDAEGARLAGTRVLYGWDHNFEACWTFQLNHPGAIVYQRSATSIARDPPNGQSPRVTILHFSLPCDFFSPNHTHEGKNDDANIATFLSTTELLLEARPVIHTQENTYGLFYWHPAYFNKLLSMITSAGYNVRWKVLNFCDYGLSASRQRLIIFASRKGYPTPEFPSKTHDMYHRRYIHDAIGNVPQGATLHHGYISLFNVAKMPYDARTALAKCVTRDGGCNYHPSGRRKLTPRELACIQSFRWDYKFHGCVTAIKKQIGNAVPPLVWKTFVEKIIQTLDDFYDGKIDSLGIPVAQHSQTSIPASPRGPFLPLEASDSSVRPPFPGPKAYVCRGINNHRGLSSVNVDNLSAQTRAMSIDNDRVHDRVITIIDDDEEDVVVVNVLRKCSPKDKVIDLTEED